MQPGNTYTTFPMRVEVGGPAVATNTPAFQGLGPVFTSHHDAQRMQHFPQHQQPFPTPEYFFVQTATGLVALATVAPQHHQPLPHNGTAPQFQYFALAPTVESGTTTFLPAGPPQQSLQPVLLPSAYSGGAANGALYPSPLVTPAAQFMQQISPPPASAVPQQRSRTPSLPSSPSFHSMVLNASTNTANTRTPLLGPSALSTFALDSSGRESSNGVFATLANSKPVDGTAEWSTSPQQQQPKPTQQSRPSFNQHANPRPSKPARPSGSPSEDQLAFTICRHYLEGKCNRRKCRFLHPDGPASAVAIAAHTATSEWGPVSNQIEQP